MGLFSIFRRKPSVPLWTGGVFPAKQVATAFGAMEPPADATYAEVNLDALPEYYNWFRDKLDLLGIGRGQTRFDCDNFASLYTDLAQVRFYQAQWEAAAVPKAEALAVGSFWYRPGCRAEGHAINCILTQQGVVYVEPQTGEIIRLTMGEILTKIRVIF